MYLVALHCLSPSAALPTVVFKSGFCFAFAWTSQTKKVETYLKLERPLVTHLSLVLVSDPVWPQMLGGPPDTGEMKDTFELKKENMADGPKVRSHVHCNFLSDF